MWSNTARKSENQEQEHYMSSNSFQTHSTAGLMHDAVPGTNDASAFTNFPMHRTFQDFDASAASVFDETMPMIQESDASLPSSWPQFQPSEHSQQSYIGMNSTMLSSRATNSYQNGPKSQANPFPTPESTNMATPEMPHVKHYYHDSFQSTPNYSSVSQNAVNYTPGTYMDHQESSSHFSPPSPSSNRIMTSPAIQISRFSRGDSPARSDREVSRLPRKRSASSLAQGEFIDMGLPSSSHSHLLPPLDADETQWDESNDRSGTGPSKWNSAEIMSLQEMDQQVEHNRRLDVVQQWFERTSLGTNGDRRSRTHTIRPDRQRSRSTGVRPPVTQPILSHNLHPGPGVQVDEESDYHYSSDEESQSSYEYPETHRADIPQAADVRQESGSEDPLPSQFIFTRPWRDGPIAKRSNEPLRFQPESSQAAVVRFMAQARDYDSSSRRATWGTSRIRRSSDGDLASVLGDTTRHLSLTTSKMRERGVSFVAKAREQVLKRSNSRSKATNATIQPGAEKVQSPEPIDERASGFAHSPFAALHYNRPKSPSIGAAILGAGGQMAAIGAGTASLNRENEAPHEGFIRKAIRRVRSKSDVNRAPASPHRPTSTGGPIMTDHKSSASVAHDESTHQKTAGSSIKPGAGSGSASKAPKMQLTPRSANVMPDLDGFKLQILELNPLLDVHLVERMAHDQVRRYKRLVKNKVEHAGAVAGGSCKSARLCAATGGVAELHPSKQQAGDAMGSSALFKITSGTESDDDELAFDGTVAPAAFPEGIPLPPAKQLPARFECPLCFEVKTFQKPSDWTKHVHEDVQPFTCTFLDCPEPRSFKRKADWVRHENERHRHLEWWECNLPDCAHKCYRKDNFVQHLVREHKCKEPTYKNRASSSNKSKVKNSKMSSDEQMFWDTVDACRHGMDSDPQHEPCKFCGNICASWKKLSVHVGKHMEQIALPVLELAEKRKVNKDTIISPIAPLQPNSTLTSMQGNVMGGQEQQPLMPFRFDQSASHLNTSAEQSAGYSQSFMAPMTTGNYHTESFTSTDFEPMSHAHAQADRAYTYRDFEYAATDFPEQHGFDSADQHVPTWQQMPTYDSSHAQPQDMICHMPVTTTADMANHGTPQYFSSPEQHQQASLQSTVPFTHSTLSYDPNLHAWGT